MNFKDVYKAMTEEIQPSTELLDNILNSKKEKAKKFVFPAKKIYTVALAAMFVITAGTMYFKAGVDNYMPSDKKTSAKQNQNISPQPYSKTNVSDSSDTSVNHSESNVIGEYDAKAYSALPKTDESENAESTVEKTRMIAQDNDMQQSDAMMEEHSNTEAEKFATSEKASSVSRAGFEREDIVLKNISISEYWDYIGVNIISKMHLPYDMVFCLPETVAIEFQNGTVTKDEVVVGAVSQDGIHSMNLIISKVCPQYGNSSIMVDGVYVGVESDTLSSEEVSKILLSIR